MTKYDENHLTLQRSRTTLHFELQRYSHQMLYHNDTCREQVTIGLHLQVKNTLLITRQLLEMVLHRIKPIQFQESVRNLLDSVSLSELCSSEGFTLLFLKRIL